MGDPQHDDSYSVRLRADPRGRLGCVRAASDITARHPRIYGGGGTETDLGEQRVWKKQAWEERESPGTEQCVCVWWGGEDRDSDAISIRSQGEEVFSLRSTADLRL